MIWLIFFTVLAVLVVFLLLAVVLRSHGTKITYRVESRSLMSGSGEGEGQVGPGEGAIVTEFSGYATTDEDAYRLGKKFDRLHRSFHQGMDTEQ